jgi:hypothetical protein
VDGDRLTFTPAISPFSRPDGRVASEACTPMKSTLALWISSLSSLFAIPASTTLTLVNDPNFNRITVAVDPGSGLGDTEVTTLTGTVQAALNIDPLAGTTSELTLTNGRANGSNMTFSRNIFVANYTINVTGLSAAISTLVPPGLVTPATGQFAAEQHSFSIDQGTISGSTGGLIGNNTINESFTPANPATGTGTGTGTVVLTSSGDSGIYRNYNVSVTLPVSISDEFLAGTIPVAITATGTVKATGTVQVPRTEYLAWTVAQNIPGAPFEGDANGDGVANGVVWALGLGANANPRPHLPRPHPSVPGAFLVPLPPGGTVAPILIQSSPQLGSWSAASGVLAPANPLPAGSSGNIAIQSNGSPTRFIRILVNES